MGEIQEAAARAFAAAGGPAGMAVLKRHDASRSLQCEVTVYFSPGAASIAAVFGAESCGRPTRANLELLAGDELWEEG